MKPKECNHKQKSTGTCKLLNLKCNRVIHCPVENSEFRKVLETIINQEENK